MTEWLYSLILDKSQSVYIGEEDGGGGGGGGCGGGGDGGGGGGGGVSKKVEAAKLCHRWFGVSLHCWYVVSSHWCSEKDQM